MAALPLASAVAGPPFIFLHGVSASIYCWTPEMIAPFVERGPCYALSLPGHYPAALPPDFVETALTAELIARVTGAAIQELTGSEPAMLVGHSTGGFAALAVAAYRTAPLRGVISIGGFARGVWTGSLAPLQRLARGGGLQRAAFKAFFRWLGVNHFVFWWAGRLSAHAPGKVGRSPAYRASTAASLAPFRRLALPAMLAYYARMPDIDITPLLSHIAVPVLALAGASDPVVPPAQARLIAAHAPQAELVLLEGVGHSPFFEAPEAYSQAVGAWLGSGGSRL